MVLALHAPDQESLPASYMVSPNSHQEESLSAEPDLNPEHHWMWGNE